MGNRTPRSQCAMCLEWFKNKNDLEKHRKALDHMIKLMSQSRYITITEITDERS